MYVGDATDGVTFQARPGVMADRYSFPHELVWRYMPLPRFLDVLKTGALWFTRLSYYVMNGDKLEGSAPAMLPKIRDDVLRERGEDVARYRAEASEFWLRVLRTVVVNCWYKDEHESALMWERYGGDEDAVAIVSSLDRFIDAMPPEVTVGHVEYVDFATEQSYSSNPRDRAFMKSRTLKDEREVRAVFWELQAPDESSWLPPGHQTDAGYRVPVNLNTLISRVTLSPRSSHCRPIAEQALSAAGIAAPVEESECSGAPQY